MENAEREGVRDVDLISTGANLMSKGSFGYSTHGINAEINATLSWYALQQYPLTS